MSKVAWRRLLGIYKERAKRKDIEWSLTDEEAKLLFLGDCYYCGQEPRRNFSPYKTRKDILAETRAKSWIIVNGIDRLDNERGYYLMNSVSCCAECNYKKGSDTLEEFETWIERILDYRTRKD
jgi:hypothetical protein